VKLTTHSPQVLAEDEISRIWNAALATWAQVPLRAPGPDAFMQALRDYGCDVRGDRIHFPQAVREKVLARINAERERHGPYRPAIVDSDTITFHTNGQGFHCCDTRTGSLRPATTEDLAEWSRLCDAIPGLQRGHPTYIPQDVPVATCDVHAFATIILNSRVPCRVSVYAADLIPFFIALQAVVDGSEEQARKAPVFNTTCYVNSPFMISREAIDIAMRARETMGLPFRVFAMPVAGATAPGALAGAMVQSVAECLALNTVTLALDDRVTGWTESMLGFDMRAGTPVANAPDGQLLSLMARQMGAWIFGGTYTAVGALSTTAKTPGAQSCMEKALDAMWAFASGVRSFASLGVLAASDAASATQLMLDLELVHTLERLARGARVDEDTLAAEVIREVAPRGAKYLVHEHTAEHFREELWAAELMDRRFPSAWMQDERTMLDRARDKALRMSESAENQCPLTDEQRRQVAEIVAEADAFVAKRKPKQTG